MLKLTFCYRRWRRNVFTFWVFLFFFFLKDNISSSNGLTKVKLLLQVWVCVCWSCTHPWNNILAYNSFLRFQIGLQQFKPHHHFLLSAKKAYIPKLMDSSIWKICLTLKALWLTYLGNQAHFFYRVIRSIFHNWLQKMGLSMFYIKFFCKKLKSILKSMEFKGRLTQTM